MCHSIETIEFNNFYCKNVKMCDKKSEIPSIQHSEDGEISNNDNHTIDDNIALLLSIDPTFGATQYEEEVRF